MKLLTLNCHSWQEDNQIQKIKYLANIIKEKQYDVIALQEVSQRRDAKIVEEKIKEDNFIYLLVKELKKLNVLDYSFLWDISHIGYDIYDEGLAILTKHKVINQKSFYISRSKDINNYKSRNILKATIKVKDREFDFYSCHLGWWNDKDEPFKEQVDSLSENIDITRETFIMGDFNNNAFINDEGYSYLLSKGFEDTYSMATQKDNGITVPGEIAGWEKSEEAKRLDLILTNKKINVINSQVIFNGINKNVISDHFGVEVNLDMR